MNFIIALISGFIFASGLTISQMINPEVVVGFLDVMGNWNYSLAFVMAGAVMFNLVAFKVVTKRSSPVCAQEFFLPKNTQLTKNLIIGSALFGIGWGLVGICPGPALVNLANLNSEIVLFVGSMLAGMFLANKLKIGG